ncbi:hypothetical protein L207DRAFT_581824 [Hyaloscypha variabilis F]|uniref:Glycine-rich cell wall structural protein 1 n=1 Tax=Hyaloscypha variabilis (strain UAMH 11265 / GT02V1 / F) TaxID=1149755 RepID=A0A2J6RS82_HYAVF|nr:hypothetical protein L207DRAFT_581824 [Hyaloscypha variabilis F]
METVNNLASAASRAIWGDGAADSAQSKENETQGQEPLSGETGDVKAGEPYDKGNAEPTSTPAEPKPVVDEPASTTSTEEPKISTLPLNPKVVDTTAVTAVDELSSVEPATADPALQPKTEAEKAAVVDTNGTARDVDAGAAKDDGPLKFTHGEGTGELPIKSTSLKADGAEVDAATPEAGKEADRVFKDKSASRESGAAVSQTSSEEVGGKDEKSGKTKLKDKIKEKLHIGHKDKD